MNSADTTGQSGPAPQVAGGGPRWLPAFVATALVIAMSAAVLGWRLLNSFSFLNDDLIQFDLANRTGLSRDLLLMNVFQHFGPVNRALHLMLFSVGELNPDFGALTSVLLVVCLLTVTAWLAAELGLSLPRRLLLVVATGGSLSLLDTAVWADAALHILPALLVTYLVAALQLRGIRTGHRGWWVATVAVFSVGLLTQERALFALPLAVLVDVLLLWRGEPWRQRGNRLLALRTPLLAMTSIAAVAALLIQLNYVTPGAGKSSLSVAGQTALTALTGAQFPQLIGYQPDGALSLGRQLIALLVIVLAVGILIGINPRNRGPVMFFLAVFGLYWGFLALSPILDEPGIAGTATRLHNAVYVTVPAYLAIFSLEGPAGWSRASARHSRWIGIGVVGLVFGLVTLAGNIFTAADWPRYRAAHQYWEGLNAARAMIADSATTVVPIQAPASVADGWAVGIGHQEYIFALLDPGWRIDDLQSKTVIIDDRGTVRDVELEPVAAVAAVSSKANDDSGGSAGAGGARMIGSNCLQPTSINGHFSLVPGPGVVTEPLYARLRYTSDTEGQVWIIPSSAGVGAGAVAPVEVLAGTHEVLVPLLLDKIHGMPADGMPVEALQVSPIAGSSFCIDDLSVVTPVVADAGSCWNINVYGIRTEARPSCPE